MSKIQHIREMLLCAVPLVVAIAALTFATLPCAWAAEDEIVDESVYPVVYERDDSTCALVFQKGREARSEYGTLKKILSSYESEELPTILLVGYDVTDVIVADTFRPRSMKSWFWNLSDLKRADLAKLDMSRVETVENLFWMCRSLESVSLPQGQTLSSLKTMSGMFWDCDSLRSVDLSGFDISGVEAADSMFSGCKSLESISLPKRIAMMPGTSVAGMFSGCSLLKSIDFSSASVSGASDVRSMFSGCSSLESVDLAGFDSSGVTDMWGMFSGCSVLKSVDLSEFTVLDVTDMEFMFSNCELLESVLLPKTLSMASNAKMDGMFFNCPSLKSVTFGDFNVTGYVDMSDMFGRCSSLESITLPVVSSEESNVNMSRMFQYCDSLKHVDLTRSDIAGTADMRDMFWGCKSLESVEPSRRAAVRAKIDSMFFSCSSLKSVDLSMFDFSDLESVEWLFSGCSSLESIDFSNISAPKLSNWKGYTDGCISLKSASFRNAYLPKYGKGNEENGSPNLGLDCSAVLESIDLSGAQIPGLTNLTLDLGKGNTIKAINLSDAQLGLTTLDFGFGSEVRNSSLKSVNLSRLHCGTTSAANLFEGCVGLEEVELYGFSVDDASGMFRGCTALKSVNDAAIGRDLRDAFAGCTSLEYCELDVERVYDDKNMARMFSGCTKLKEASFFAGSNAWITDMSEMFSGCSSLRSVQGLDVFRERWDDKKKVPSIYGLKSARSMFEGCSSLAAIDINGLSMYSATDFSSMFAGCAALKEIDFQIAEPRELNSANASRMFEGCTSLCKIVTGGDGNFAGVFPDGPSNGPYETSAWVDCDTGERFLSQAIPAERAATYVFEQVRQYPLSKCSVSFVGSKSDYAYAYTGKAVCPRLSVVWSLSVPLKGLTPKGELREGVDYKVEYRNNVKPGEAVATIRGIGNWVGSREMKFKIVDSNGLYGPQNPGRNPGGSAVGTPSSLSSAEVTVPARTWTGKAQRPIVAVKLDSKALREGRDYTVSCKAAKNVGSYKVTVTGKGSYTGTKTATFKINPKGTSVKKLKAAKRGFTATWKKPSKAALKQTTGYQVRYSLKKSMKGAKSKTVKATSSAGKKCTLKVSKLKAGKKYYVQVRTYKKASGKTYYSSWSKAKAVKTKK